MLSQGQAVGSARPRRLPVDAGEAASAELRAHQEGMAGSVRGASVLAGKELYLVALAWLSAFYGLERLVKREREEEARSESAATKLFWLHTGFFGLYNILIEYLLLDVRSRARGTRRPISRPWGCTS